MGEDDRTRTPTVEELRAQRDLYVAFGRDEGEVLVFVYPLFLQHERKWLVIAGGKLKVIQISTSERGLIAQLAAIILEKGRWDRFSHEDEGYSRRGQEEQITLGLGRADEKMHFSSRPGGGIHGKLVSHPSQQEIAEIIAKNR